MCKRLRILLSILAVVSVAGIIRFSVLWPEGQHAAAQRQPLFLLPTNVAGIPIVPELPVDAIPPLDDPEYDLAANANTWLNPDDVVIGVHLENRSSAYPVKSCGGMKSKMNPLEANRQSSLTVRCVNLESFLIERSRKRLSALATSELCTRAAW